MNYNKNLKPDANKCPKKFCFNWDRENEKCDEVFGKCFRETSSEDDFDYYTSCEPELIKHDLPWFYFITSADALEEEVKEKYLRESAKLWGEKDIYIKAEEEAITIIRLIKANIPLDQIANRVNKPPDSVKQFVSSLGLIKIPQ